MRKRITYQYLPITTFPNRPGSVEFDEPPGAKLVRIDAWVDHTGKDYVRLMWMDDVPDKDTNLYGTTTTRLATTRQWP